MITHTDECAERIQLAINARAAWVGRYPRHCPKCEGRGGVEFAGSFDYRAGVGEPPSFDYCEECIGHGKCSRCAAPLPDPETGEGPCPACGWDYNDALPEIPECECYLALDPFEDP